MMAFFNNKIFFCLWYMLNETLKNELFLEKKKKTIHFWLVIFTMQQSELHHTTNR